MLTDVRCNCDEEYDNVESGEEVSVEEECALGKKLLAELNKKIIAKMVEAVETFGAVDMTEIIQNYTCEALRISSRHHISAVIDDDGDALKACPRHKSMHDSVLPPLLYAYDDCAYSQAFGVLAPQMPKVLTPSPRSALSKMPPTHYTALRELFCSSNSKRDSIALFLEANMPPEVEEAAMNYVRLEDVIKSKGNSVNGPRREDVGKFNIKVFEAHTRHTGGVTVEVQPNIWFYDSLRNIIDDCDKILYSGEAFLVSYDASGTTLLGRCVLVVYLKDNQEIACSAADTDRIFFSDLDRSSFVACLRPYANIALLSLKTFVLYNIIFYNRKSAERAYSEFFIKEA